MEKRRRRILNLSLLILFVLCMVAFARRLGGLVLNTAIRRTFPVVARIRTSELAAWLGDSKRQQPRLLDVREAVEHQVSHLDGARHVTPGSDPSDLDFAKDQPIVTYCSVGYRSAAYAEKLREAGFTNVRNLEGSIFQWANENRPVVQAGGQPAAKIHPYNRVWGLLLRRGLRASVLPVGSKSKI